MPPSIPPVAAAAAAEDANGEGPHVHQQHQEPPPPPLPLEFGCDRWPLHYACRTGNLEHVTYLVSVQKTNVNEPDAHDATPLYLAALTGHDTICQFLLENGAVCDPTGDIARVFYVALTPALRRMLRQWSLTAASKDPFLDELRHCFNAEKHADCVVKCFVTGRCVYLHRIMLHARCPRLAQVLESNVLLDDDHHDGLVQFGLPSEHDDSVMVSILEYLYTGRFDVRDRKAAITAQEMASVYQLEALRDDLSTALERDDNQGTRTRARFQCDISHTDQLRKDMRKIAQLASTPHAEFDRMARLQVLVDWSNVTVECHNHTFSVHKFRLCTQSEYFERALQGDFKEAQESFVVLSHLVDSPEAFRLAIQWMYADEFLDDPSCLDVALQVLELGFAILCPRLCTHVANAILIPAVNDETVFEMLSLARLHGFDRLEDTCVKFIGCYLSTLSHRPELRAVLAEEAADIKQGGDIDVVDIPLAAEIRRAIVTQGDRNERDDQLELLRGLVKEAMQA